MSRVHPVFLLSVWMLGFAIQGIMDVLVPSYVGSFFIWGSGAGWQREAGLWNIAAAVTIFFAIRSGSQVVQRGVLPFLAALSTLFAANHLIALLIAPTRMAHWVQVLFFGGMGTLGLSTSLADETPGERTRNDGSIATESRKRGLKIADAVASQKRRNEKPEPIEIKPEHEDTE